MNTLCFCTLACERESNNTLAREILATLRGRKENLSNICTFLHKAHHGMETKILISKWHLSKKISLLKKAKKKYTT